MYVCMYLIMSKYHYVVHHFRPSAGAIILVHRTGSVANKRKEVS